jgi:hypothetical protein
MKSRELGRFALSACVATAMLAGCSGHASNGVVPISGAPDHLPNHKSFYYTGGEQDFKVPAGVTQLKVLTRGAAGGGDDNYEGRDIQALGGRVRAIISVTPGEKLAVFVGGEGTQPSGGFNGGGSGAGGRCCQGYGGGGASDIRQGGDSLKDRILVAGGGGGAEAFGWPQYGGLGGSGGGTDGGAGTDGYTGGSSHGGYGGGGGTQSGGGAGGEGAGYSGSYGDAGNPGGIGVGGAGGQGNGRGSGSYVGGGGGGGGGGYYGGGGGGGGVYYSGPGGGGGGGSAYVESSATNVHVQRGWKNARGNGLVVLSWQ